MKLFEDWNLFEKILLLFSILIIGISGFIFNSDLLTVVCSAVGVVTALLLAKGKNLGQVFGVLITILYLIVSFNNKILW
jgi:nicotinamide riboside transporter PnuC